MNADHRNKSERLEGGPPTGGPEDLEILLGRLVDGEAGNDDRLRFDALATGRPELWRMLAERQQQMIELTSQFEEDLEPSLLDLPDHVRRPALLGRGTMRLVAMSGWAALLVVSFTWALSALSGSPAASPRGLEARGALPAPVISADEHFDRYLEADNVLGEMEPMVLQAEELPDGRIALRYLRRVEEVTILDP
ncbi:MAG: hypothetical protein ACYTGC_08185, partial [Planctomycetota bacterium]